MSKPVHPPGPIADELSRLVNHYCDGTISASELKRLEELLQGNPAAQQYFLAYLDLHARLCWEFGAGLSMSPQPESSQADSALEERQPVQMSSHRFGMFLLIRKARNLVGSGTGLSRLAMAASFAVLVSAAVWYLLRPSELDQGPSAVVAKVTQCLAARWSDQEAPISRGTELKTGVLDLAQGLVEITCTNGAVLMLEAPAQLEIIHSQRMFLRSGRVFARVPIAAGGLVIETSKARFLEKGREFGVMAGPRHEALLQVYDGTVFAQVKDEQDAHANAEHVTSGQARFLDGASGSRLQPLPFVSDRFLRTFPVPRRRHGPDVPFNQSRFDAVHIYRAPAGITIDADLSDWDRRGMFRSACIAPYHENYHVEGMMMYDAERVYIGGHVGDPYPLRNRVDYSTDPSFFWAGGSVVVRLSTDKALGWPLQGIPWWHPRAERLRLGHRPVDVSERIVHVGMWQTQPDRKPHLYLAYGMDSHGRVFDPKGWRGVFREDTDGRGYVFEYAIPWSLLYAASDPPRPGDPLAAVWHVHYSDEDGRTCFGQLVEITNSAEKPYHFQIGSTWGKAVYHGTDESPDRGR